MERPFIDEYQRGMTGSKKGNDDWPGFLTVVVIRDKLASIMSMEESAAGLTH